MFLLLPLHYVMGPIHGAIVNWCGHRYGYQNGELFQNNHHKFGMSPNFAVRKFEIDPCYQVMRLLAALRIIDFGEHPQQTRFPARAAS
jgi:stearoyl-CoA desaturase (delta-9 desaturase)